MVEHGEFERGTDHITVRPEVEHNWKTGEKIPINPNYKFGLDEIQIPVEKTDMMEAHIDNFIKCMHSRETPHLDVETGAKAVVVINLAVESYRQGKVLYWDEKRWKHSDKPVKA